MKGAVLAGAVLCVLGMLALVYQGFTFTHREKVLDVGPIHATAEKKESIPVPPIFGVIALVGGLVLVVVGTRK